jgi:hypothetical protein
MLLRGSPGGRVTATLPGMAKLGWIGSVALAVGASAGAAALQFGLGYGLGIISWSPMIATGPQTPDSVWLSSLAWTTWIAATSTVVGAISADRRSAGEVGSAPPRLGVDGGDPGAPGLFATAIWRVLLAVSGAVGALLSVALVLVPAHTAARPDTSTPQLIAAGYAVVGIIVGILVAVAALIARAGAANVIMTGAWIWLLAIASVIDGVAMGRGLGTAPLGVFPFHQHDDNSTWSFPSAALILGAALLIGIVVAWIGARRGDHRVGVSLSGGFGPLIVMVAYILTTPDLVGIDKSHVSAFILAPYALITGVAGSVLLVAGLSAWSTAQAAPKPITGETTTAVGRARPQFAKPAPFPRRETAKPDTDVTIPIAVPSPPAEPTSPITKPVAVPALADSDAPTSIGTARPPTSKRTRR